LVLGSGPAESLAQLIILRDCHLRVGGHHKVADLLEIATQPLNLLCFFRFRNRHRRFPSELFQIRILHGRAPPDLAAAGLTQALRLGATRITLSPQPQPRWCRSELQAPCSSSAYI